MNRDSCAKMLFLKIRTGFRYSGKVWQLSLYLLLQCLIYLQEASCLILKKTTEAQEPLFVLGVLKLLF